MSGLAQEDMDVIIAVLKKYPQVKEAILFGSRAKGNYKNGSDIDIAIKGDHVEKVEASISSELNEMTSLPYFFDIIAFDAIGNHELKEHILRVGVLIYSFKLKVRKFDKEGP